MERVTSLNLSIKENPTYEGGVWHVEGMENEQIVSSGIYYYDVKNISKSELHFRKSVAAPYYINGDDDGVEFVYQMRTGKPRVQEIGYILHL
jgi:hypothetical protein